MNAIIIHGSFGSPQENWIPWLKAQLEAPGINVFAPGFPTPRNQSLRAWINVFREYSSFMGKNSIIIAHSLGVPFALRVLEDLEAKAAFLVSGFVEELNEEKFMEKNKSFVNREFNWKKIKKNCPRFFVFHSDNDPFVPLEKAKNLAEKLGVKPIIVRGGKHFNESAGYNEFPLLLEKILGLI